MLWLAYEAVIPLGVREVTVHIWFVSPSGFIAGCRAPSAPFSLPSSVVQRWTSETSAWKKLQNGPVYKSINVMATDSVFFLGFGRVWIILALAVH